MEWRWQSAVRQFINQSVGQRSAGRRAWLRLPEHSFLHPHLSIFLHFTFLGSPGFGRFGGFARALPAALYGSAHRHKSSSGVSESSGRLPALLRVRRSAPSARATVAATSATVSTVTATARLPESISS